MKEMEMWLARDFDGTLQLIIGAKPVKLQFMWGYPMDGNYIELDSSLFPEVKWLDDEPTKVKLVKEMK